MKRLPILPVLGFAFLASSVQARLGETLAQCVERYGPVTDERAASVKESDPKACVFSKLGITALAEFKDGVVWKIVFRKPGMTLVEAESLLKANIPDGGWGPALKFGSQDFRLSADRRRIAIYTPTKAEGEISTLTIASRDYGAANFTAYSAKVDEALRNAKERKTGKQLDGF